MMTDQYWCEEQITLILKKRNKKRRKKDKNGKNSRVIEKYENSAKSSFHRMNEWRWREERKKVERHLIELVKRNLKCEICMRFLHVNTPCAHMECSQLKLSNSKRARERESESERASKGPKADIFVRRAPHIEYVLVTCAFQSFHPTVFSMFGNWCNCTFFCC